MKRRSRRWGRHPRAGRGCRDRCRRPRAVRAEHLGAERALGAVADQRGRRGEDLRVRGQDARPSLAPAETACVRALRSTTNAPELAPAAAHLAGQVTGGVVLRRRGGARTASTAVMGRARRTGKEHLAGPATGTPPTISAPDGQGRQAGGPEGPGTKAATRGRRPRRSRTALVLGGGGFTGGVYEIGALRALDLLAVNRTVTSSTSTSARARAPSSPRSPPTASRPRR